MIARIFPKLLATRVTTDRPNIPNRQLRVVLSPALVECVRAGLISLVAYPPCISHSINWFLRRRSPLGGELQDCLGPRERADCECAMEKEVVEMQKK